MIFGDKDNDGSWIVVVYSKMFTKCGIVSHMCIFNIEAILSIYDVWDELPNASSSLYEVWDVVPKHIGVWTKWQIVSPTSCSIFSVWDSIPRYISVRAISHTSSMHRACAYRSVTAPPFEK